MTCYQNANIVSQKRVDKLIVDFIISEMLSLHTIELPAFSNSITGLQPNRTVMSRPTLRKIILDDATEMKLKLITVLAEQKFVATTTNCWTTYGKAYIGVTVHWIDKQTSERKSACLALKRMKGSHTFDAIAKILEAIHKEFKIQRKIVKTTTDNRSNFMKAFLIFGEKSEEYDYEIELEEQENREADQDVVLDLDPINLADMVAENLHDEDEEEYSLPKHQRWACHFLHMVASKDADKAEGDAQYKKVS